NGIDFIDRPVHFLSYGQKKRVAIASVIAMENEIVLLDEPTAGLDPVSTRSIVDIIKGLNKNNIKIVISSHDMNLMYEICDYIYVLDKGILIDEGKAENVFINENNIIQAGLESPWLVKVHRNMNLPLFKKEEDLYKYWKERELNTNK
ncbi:AAA family ATPase, partial [Clostridium perfringens]